MQETEYQYEILINDDASTDGMQDVLVNYQRQYSDVITLVLHNENQYSTQNDTHLH